MKTGNTYLPGATCHYRYTPQWSPVMKTGNTANHLLWQTVPERPQWSPVMKTGNTCRPTSGRSCTGRLNGARS